MRILLQGFAGETPRTQPFYLAETGAAACTDARLERGDLAPFREPAAEHTFPGPVDAVTLHGATWRGWSGDADAAQGPVAQDRLYVTRVGAPPTVIVGGAERTLALATPTARPTVALTGTLDTALAETVLYAWTWVTDLGEESPPSPISGGLQWSPGRTVTVSGLPAALPSTTRGYVGKRIYRAVTSAAGVTELFFVAEVAASATSYMHNPATAPDAEAIATKDFDPPASNLQGLTPMPNGMMAAFRGKEVWFCEPYQPHAWPASYMLTVGDWIVGLAALGTALVILTSGTPWIAQGLHPEQMALQKVEANRPCLSKRGIVDMGYAAIYPSDEGLVQIAQDGSAQLVSAHLWTREQWQALGPRDVIAARHGARYAFVTAERRVDLVDLGGAQPFLVPTTFEARALHSQVETGDLFLLADDRLTLTRFDAGAPRAYRWRSKPFRVTPARSFGVARIDTEEPEGGGAVMRVYADGALVATIPATNAAERLPAGLAHEWQLEVEGTATVIRAQIAHVLAETEG